MKTIILSAVLWLYPTIFCTASLAANCYLALRNIKDNPLKEIDPVRRRRLNRIIQYLHFLLVTLLVANTGLASYGAFQKPSTPLYSTEAYLGANLSMTLIFCGALLPDPDIPYTPALPNISTWILSILFESAILFMYHADPFSVDRQAQSQLQTPIMRACEGLTAGRILVLTCMVGIYLFRERRNPELYSDDESESLLSTESAEQGYGTKPDNKKGDAQTVSAFDYLVGFRDLIPYLWPSKNVALQLVAAFCFLLLAAQRVVNILVPHQLGLVVDHLGKGQFPLSQILLYVLWRGLQGQQGVIGSLRAILWIPISQSAYSRLTVAAFEHVMGLSLEFHLNKRIGEVISALSKGSAINTFLDGLIFQLFPMVFDLFIAAIYFFIALDAFYAIIVVAVMWFYLFITIYMAKYRGRARRETATRERAMEAAKTDAIMAYDTVHQNSALPLEMSKFRRLVKHFQISEYSVFFSLNMLNAVQNFIFVLSVLLVCLLAAFQIEEGMHQVAMFVTVLTYLAQLQAPLNFFGSFYTQVQNNMVDAERMLALYKIVPTVRDKPNAKVLDKCTGAIEFSNINFAYDSRKPTLSGVSFSVKPGTTTAIVGESGSGKSTCLKLLFRSYETGSGSVSVDGNDVRDVTMESLRSHFGIVPQDTILFNETVLYNVSYSKPDASMEEVEAACKAASIHDRIMTFPDGYHTNVGERGLRLSGGEKQRIAIARAVLRRPQIMFLDEATASLDSTTERAIQEELKTICQGRTTIAIAHRLSTITDAEQIIVMSQGVIVERGTHEELFALKGRYKAMWDKQTKKNQKAAAQQNEDLVAV